MKKGSFNLTGKAIDCRRLPEMGDAGKEIFRALKVVCNGFDNPEYAEFESISSWGFLVIDDGEYANAVKEHVHPVTSRLQPIDVLGQARIDAAKDGATLVFEGDVVPRHSNVIFYADGTKMHGCDTREYTLGPDHIVIAHKPLEKKQPSIESRILSERVGAKHSHYFKDVSDLDEIDVYRVCDLFEINDPSGAKQHAIKKLLCSGQRGAKDERKDLEEARDTIIRKLAMMTEDRE